MYAAASTREALQAIALEFELGTGVQVVYNFGSSGDLAQQILAAAKADVFLSAGGAEMDKVETAGLVAPRTRHDLLSNQLVVIETVDGRSIFTVPFDAAQLASDRVKRLSIANVETVPAGRYAKSWLEAQGVWPAVQARVLPGVDVRAALAAVESGGAQVGIVYRTDVARSAKARIAFAVPVEEGPRIRYPIAVLAPRPHEPEARRFVDFTDSAAAREAFARYGFAFATEPAGSAR